MQIVIEINDNEYMGIKKYPNNITSYPVTIHLYDAVRNGTPLPKGHGRLIDVDKLKEDVGYTGYNYDFQNCLDDAPTIIEADTESVIHWGCSDAEIAKSFIEDVEAVKDLLPQESEDEE